MFVTPGSQTTRWFSRSTSRMRRSRVSATRIPSSTGSAPPDRPDPAAARDPRHLVLVARADDVGDLLRRRGQDDRAGAHVVLQQPVGLVGLELVRVVDDVRVADDLPQPPDEGMPCGARAGRWGRLRAELRVRGHRLISTPTASMVGTL